MEFLCAGQSWYRTRCEREWVGAVTEAYSTRNLVKIVVWRREQKKHVDVLLEFPLYFPFEQSETPKIDKWPRGPVCFHVESNQALWKQ